MHRSGHNQTPIIPPTPRPRTRRTVKDTVFRDLFGAEERKGYALELYNALTGKDYADPAELELNTLDDAIYMGMRNDVSFIVGDEMVLLEHQSTRNPNIPLRGLMYVARLYERVIDGLSAEASLYGGKPITLPAPRFVVLYNGRRDAPEREEMRLSDLFPDGAEHDLEMKAAVLNINAGHNAWLPGASSALAGYVRFVELFREYNGAMGPDAAVDAAIDGCIREGHLADYFRKRRAEVKSMFLTEYDEEKELELLRREWHEEGLKQGIERGLKQGLEQGLESMAAAMREIGIGEAQVAEALEAARRAQRR